MVNRPQPVDHSFIIATAKGMAEAKKFFNSDNAARSASKTLLRPSDVAGEYDVGRGLMTTLGGVPRVLTQDDLRQFVAIAKKQAGKLKKGVTAKQIIDLSLPIDRKRANAEIRTAVPVSSHGGQIKFMTNSGPDSDRSRHYVTVNMVNFLPVMASAIKLEKTGPELAKSPLQISCSCGRWRYWLAYLATKGNFNSGHAEDSFPKIRNPGLAGIACKHILRVVSTIDQSPSMKLFLTDMVKRARATVESKKVNEKVVDARAMAEKMKAESHRQRQVKTTDEKRSARRTVAQRKALAEAAKPVPPPKKTTASTRRAGPVKPAAPGPATLTPGQLAMAQQFGMTPEQALAFLAAR